MIIKVSRDTGIRTDDLSSVPVYRYTALTSLSPRRYSTPTRRNSFKYRRWCVRGCEQCDLGYFTIPSLSLSLSPSLYRDERNEFLEPKPEKRIESVNEREIDFDGLVVG